MIKLHNCVGAYFPTPGHQYIFSLFFRFKFLGKKIIFDLKELNLIIKSKLLPLKIISFWKNFLFECGTITMDFI